MTYLVAYLLAVLGTLAWVVFDRNAVDLFEIFHRRRHSTAYETVMYREWVFNSLQRAVLLATLIGVGVVAATFLFQKNPWELEQLPRAALLGFMLFGSLGLIAFPHLASRLRFKKFLHFKAKQMHSLVTILSSEESIHQQLEPADRFDVGAGWAAFHPRQHTWEGNQMWSGLTPIVYIHGGAERSFIVPVDWEYSLAWKLPSDTLQQRRMMPFSPLWTVNAIRNLPGCDGWSVVHAEMDFDYLEVGE